MSIEMIDLRGGRVQIAIKDGPGGRTLWVNREGVCVCRIVGVEGDIHLEKPDDSHVTCRGLTEIIHKRSAHVRGNKRNGVVVKDYNVENP